jgi:L-lactate dehydrogenase complex protein LldG
MTARDSILARIRAAHGRGALPAAGERETITDYLRAHVPGPRPSAEGEPVARFCERSRSLASTVDEVHSRAEVPLAVAAYLERMSLPRGAVCWPEFATLDWHAAGVVVESRAARDTDAIGITGAFCAIAETGTLMLLSGPATPAAASLLPETHIAVISRARIVPGMEEAWGLLRAEHGSLPRAVNFISGPSRTADIEQTLVLGAHGPYRVHIVVTA